MKKKIITALAGEFVHPTTRQLRQLAGSAPNGVELRIYDDAEAFNHLEDSNLFLAAGLHWTQSPTVTWTESCPYLPPTEIQKNKLRAYAASGKPIFSLHGGIASYDDWPEYGQLLGFAWHWDVTTHGPVKEYRIYPSLEGSPLNVCGEFRITDENYYNVQVNLGAAYETHLKIDCGDVQLPALITSDGTDQIGGGRRAWLALGHDLHSISNPVFPKIFWSTVASLIK